MTLSINEQRAFPRIITQYQLSLPEGTPGQTIDISEEGLKFALKRSFPPVALPVTIDFPTCTLEINAQILWAHPSPVSNKYTYGARFLNMSPTGQQTLREILFFSQIEKLLNDIKDTELRHNVLTFFTVHLRTYVNEIEHLAKRLTHESIFNKAHQQFLTTRTNELLLKGDTLDKKLRAIKKSTAAKKLKDHFRYLTSTWIYKSKLIQKASRDPITHGSLFETLEAIYQQEPISEGIGAYYDNYFLSSPDSIAIRHRKDDWKELLKETLAKYAERPVYITNIGCNSCREVAELTPQLVNFGEIIFTCVDADTSALTCAQHLTRQAPSNVTLRFMAVKTLEFHKNKKLLMGFEPQQIIYCSDLMDHLPDRSFKQLIRSCMQTLLPQGHFMFSHRNNDKTIPTLSLNWLCDRKYIGRSPEKVSQLLASAGVKKNTLTTTSCDFGYMYYFIIEK